MHITDIQGDKLSQLVALGYKIRQIYSDGAIDCAKIISGDTVAIYLLPNGDIRPPRTCSTMVASTELHGAGIHPVTPNKED